MKVIREADDPVLFRFVSDSNLLRQYDFLKQAVQIGISTKGFRIGGDLVNKLNDYAVINLCAHPGELRNCHVKITNSGHQPPPHPRVPKLMKQFLEYLEQHWVNASPTHLAAYALWRLNWIHPFEEGNGRTARAICYLALCVKHGLWLPGANTIPNQIRADRRPYYAALRVCDASVGQPNEPDTAQLERYLDALLATQLQS